MVAKRLLFLFVPVLIWAACSTAIAEDKPVNVTGKWQISWEARIGTEQGMVQFQQTGKALTGTFQGQHGTPKVSGSLEGRDIFFTLEFPGSHPFTIVFSGSVTDDRMAGKFDLQGLEDGYDWHGENARSTNYSWNGIRQPKSP
jgi:hypothetical protein